MTVVTVSADLSFPDLAVVVQQQEELLGPLIRIGNNGIDATLLEFDEHQDPPQSPTVLLPADSPPDLTAGARPLAGGEAFINRRLQKLFVYRPTG